jgi:pimeloyl-ACP methyl ester carboxylesterase
LSGPVADFAERRWTSPDGLDLFARDYAAAGGGGARLPVVCLHGLTRNSKDFEAVAPRIAATGRRVIVPDVRGRGQSARDPKPANYHPKVYARDVAGLLDSLGLPRAVFLGTSMGGIITMTLAALRPKLIAAAILNDVGPEIAPEGVARILGYAGKGASIGNWQDAADYLRRTSGSAMPKFTDADWDRFARRTFRDGPNGPELDYDPAISGKLAMPGRLTTFIARLLFRRLARNRPILLLRGALSDLITPQIAARMAQSAPAIEIVVVPDVGHAPTLDEPVAVDAIARFLRTMP